MRSEDVAFNDTLTTPTSHRQIRVGREIPQSPTRRVSLSRPSPIPCNVAGVSRGRIPITVPSTGLHGWTYADYFLWSGSFHSAFDSVGESLYVSEPKRLRSSSGHGGDWRTGVDFQRDGSFTHHSRRLSCPWGRDPWGTRNCFVSCPYSFPQHCMPYRLSVGAGLFTNLLDW